MADKDFIHAVHPDKAQDESYRASDLSRGNLKDMLELPPFSNDELDALKILYSSTPNREVLNAFRDLRTKLVQRSKGNNFICMVSALCPKGGASFVAANLAASFSLDQAKGSLIIDGNLYDPSVERLMMNQPEVGLTDYLCDPSLEVKDIIYASGIPRLRVIPVGGNCEGGAEYFSSARMRAFMAEVKSRYSDRFVFVDAPPVTSSAETRILAELCDFVVLTAPYGRLTEQQILVGIEEISKERLVGLIFNN